MPLILWPCLLLALVNSIVTIGVARSVVYEPTQKLLQLLLIWLVPVVGAAIAWNVLREEAHSAFRRDGGGANPYSDSYPATGNEGHSGHDSGHHGGGDGGH